MRKYVEYPARGEEDNETEFVFDDPIAHLSARLDPVGPFFYRNERIDDDCISIAGVTETEGTERGGDGARRRSEKTTRDRQGEESSKS